MPKQKQVSKPTSTHHELVKVDLEFPRILLEFKDLDPEINSG